MASKDNKGRPSRVGHRWASLLNAFDRYGPFESVNDVRVRAHIDAHLKERRAKDALRQRTKRGRERAERIAAGQFDDEFLDRMNREAFHRKLLFKRAQTQKNPPAWISRATADTAEFTSRAWQAKLLILARKQEPNPSNIATELIERRLVPSINHNSLRDRVKSALQRIHRLETVVPSGHNEPVWPKASLRELMKPEDPLG